VRERGRKGDWSTEEDQEVFIIFSAREGRKSGLLLAAGKEKEKRNRVFCGGKERGGKV